MQLPDPRFPPAFTARGVKAPENPRSAAIMGATRGELRAADIVWARRVDRAEFAVVFEPELPFNKLSEVRLVLQTALIDCLGTLMPSQTALQIAWPDRLYCNGAQYGQTEIIAPEQTDPSAHVDWCIGYIRVDLTRKLDGLEPGLVRDQTSLSEEDAGDLDRTQIIQSCSAHLLNAVHHWESDGIRPFVDRWIGRVFGYGSVAEIANPVRSHDGTDGDVIVRGELIGVGDELELIIKRASDDQVVTVQPPVTKRPVSP
ncbi:MAG: biotin/lipoate--protein ligase family protein [Pseudomonadota bacterium]